MSKSSWGIGKSSPPKPFETTTPRSSTTIATFCSGCSMLSVLYSPMCVAAGENNCLMQPNVDPRTVDGFGDEWARFDQRVLDDEERQRLFDTYFRIFPWDTLPNDYENF